MPPENEEQQNQATEEEETISLSKKDYSMLLDRLEQLEDLESKDKDEDDDDDNLQSLVNEAKEDGREVTRNKDIDWDNLTNSQLVNILKDELSGGVIRPLEVAVHELALRMEINDLVRDPEYSDFFDHQDKIGKKLMKNPGLSVKEAYDLTVGRQKNKAAKKEASVKSEESSDKDFKRRLPDPRKAFGEKPGAPPSGTKQNDNLSLRESAKKAYEEVFGDRK